MATTKEFREYVLESLSCLDNIFCRPMMGEYLLYYDGTLFGGIYDNRVLIKPTQANSGFGLSQEIPYKGAKPMLYLEDLEDSEKVKEIVFATCEALKKK